MLQKRKYLSVCTMYIVRSYDGRYATNKYAHNPVL